MKTASKIAFNSRSTGIYTLKDKTVHNSYLYEKHHSKMKVISKMVDRGFKIDSFI